MYYGGLDHHLILQQSVRTNDLLENVFTNVRIDRAQRIVQKVGIRVRVDRSGQTYSLLLPATQIDALLSDFRAILTWQDFQSGGQGARDQYFGVEGIIGRFSERDVIVECGISYPRLLGHVRHSTLCRR